MFIIAFAVFSCLGLAGWGVLGVLARSGASGEPPETNTVLVFAIVLGVSAVLALAAQGVMSLF